jgi:Na+-driven multidrug efflux pump
MIFERLLIATGKIRLSMITQASGAIVNTIIDPLLIFSYLGFPKMGIAGAAITTVISRRKI